MQKQEHKLKKRQRVRLKSDGQDALYAAACAGSEGWVKNLQHDEYGYPMVYIKWDREHWAYNGEADRWALEAHFEPVEEEMSEKKNDKDLAESLIGFLQNWKQEDEDPPADDPNTDVDIESGESEYLNPEQYAEAVDRAAKIAAAADSFILIATRRKAIAELGDAAVLEPIAANGYQSEEGGIICEIQLGDFASYSHKSLAAEKIEQILKDKREDD